MRTLYRRLFLAVRIARLAATFKESILLFLWSGYATIRRIEPRLTMLRIRIHVRFLDNSYPVELRDISDIWEMKDVLLDNEYDMLDLTNPRTVVDLGSNIGISSAFLAVKYPNARIFAVEPNPGVYDQLKYATEPHANIELHQFALAEHDGTVQLYIGKASLGSSLAKKEGDEEVAVDGVSPSSLLSRLGIDSIDLLKFDIEGAEQYLFEGSPNLAIKAYLGEMHYDRMSLTKEEVRDRFSAYEQRSSSAGRTDREILFLRKTAP